MVSPAIYDRICAGDTIGLFQIESRAQIQMIRRSRPRNLEDLAVEVAIVRPGPIVGGAVNPYVRRREEQRRAPAPGQPDGAPRDEPAPLARSHRRLLGRIPPGSAGARRSRSDGGESVRAGDRLQRVRIPEVACRGVWFARLPVGVAPALSPGRVLRRALQ